MAGFFNQFLKQLGTGDEIHDWQHASRTFVDSLYRLSPKIGAVYHVFMDLNPVVAQVDQNSQIEIAVKEARKYRRQRNGVIVGGSALIIALPTLILVFTL